MVGVAGEWVSRFSGLGMVEWNGILESKADENTASIFRSSLHGV